MLVGFVKHFFALGARPFFAFARRLTCDGLVCVALAKTAITHMRTARQRLHIDDFIPAPIRVLTWDQCLVEPELFLGGKLHRLPDAGADSTAVHWARIIMASALTIAVPRKVIAIAPVGAGEVIDEQDVGGPLKLSERAREGIVGVPVVEVLPFEDQVSLARIDTVRRSQNHLPQLEGQMDFFVGCCACACCACCAIKSAGRVIKQLRLVFLLLVNRVVKRSADVEREVNLVGGHFALSVFGSVSFVRS